MQFTSVAFLLFAALLLPVYYVIPKKGQWMLLLAASYIFYLFAGVKYLAFILLTTVTTYAAARIIGERLARQNEYIAQNKANMPLEARKQYKNKVKKINRVWMILCLVINFGVLAVCKGLLIDPFRTAAEGHAISFLSLGLPLGISFYMFMSMGYVIDVYRGTVTAEKNFFRTALFVSFFPQLIQGPISKYSQLAPTLFSEHEFDRRQVSFGIQRMIWGFFKKMVIADRIAAAVVALKGTEYYGTGFLLLSIFYAVQIYGDFTGGIDIAIGMGEALGVKMPENFVRPFFSKNIAEYWRRWHISLGEWMKDYIFYPISVSKPMLNLSKAARNKLGNFGKRLPVYVASIATWLVTGIWHGFDLHFIVWGMLNCFFIVLSEELSPLYGKFHGKFHLKNKKWYGGFEILRMFMLMNLIRASDLFNDVGDYFARVGSIFYKFDFAVLWDGRMMDLGLSALDYIILAAGIAVLFAVSLTQEKHGSVREILYRKPYILRAVIFMALILIVLLMGSYGIGYNASSFIYTQF